VLLLLVVAIVAVLAGVATGGRLANLASIRVRHWYLLVIAGVAQAAAGTVPGAARVTLVAGCCVAVATWCALNSLRRAMGRGVALVGLGVILNTVVIALNRGMPVSAAALRAAGLPATLNVAKGHLDRHAAMTASTRLAWLGDRIPVPQLGVLSPGDVLMLAGVAATLVIGLRATGSTASADLRPGESTLRTPVVPTGISDEGTGIYLGIS